MSEKSLRVENLHVSIKTRDALLSPVEDVSFEIPGGSIVGVVGESGCGKSMTARAIMGLLPAGGSITGGRVLLGEEEISAYTPRQMRSINGNRISMIFQEPMSSLNPVVKVGKQIEETLILHTKLSRAERRAKVIDIMRQVGVPEPERRFDAYPFELSGGLRQRVMIAMAMICRPKLIIADEPTTALDVTVEAQILQLMKGLRDEIGTSIILISHNLGVIAQVCDYVYVMYAGRVVEQAETFELFDHPAHPYTRGLMNAVASLDGDSPLLDTIPGVVPNLLHLPEGCSFSPRCDRCTEACRRAMPELAEVAPGHLARCINTTEG